MLLLDIRPHCRQSGSHSKTNRQVVMVQNDHCRASGAMFDLRSLWVCQSREQRRYNSLQLWLRAGSVGTSVGMRRRGAALDRQTDALAGTPHHPWDLHPTAAPPPALSGSGTAPDAPLAASPLHHAPTPPSLVPRVREKTTQSKPKWQLSGIRCRITPRSHRHPPTEPALPL